MYNWVTMIVQQKKICIGEITIKKKRKKKQQSKGNTIMKENKQIEKYTIEGNSKKSEKK